MQAIPVPKNPTKPPSSRLNITYQADGPPTPKDGNAPEEHKTLAQGVLPAKPSYAEIGRAAAHKAQREELLKELQAQGWNLSATAKELRMGTASAVIRAIHKHKLTKEYEAARKRGDIFPGPHGES